LGLIYLDSCVCIYLVEASSEFHAAARTATQKFRDSKLVISHLVVAECLSGALKHEDGLLLQDYEDFFESVTILDLNEPIFRQAAFVVAKTKLKMPDAIHLACAQFHGCEALLTNDKPLSDYSHGFARSILG
jgi:uncharacterized protein